MQIDIPPDTLERLRESAARNLRSLSKEIVFILNTWAENTTAGQEGLVSDVKNKSFPGPVVDAAAKTPRRERAPSKRPPGRTGIRGVKLTPGGRYVATYRGTYLGSHPTADAAAEAVRLAETEITPPAPGETADAYRARLQDAGVPEHAVADVLAAVAVPDAVPFAAPRATPPAETFADWDASD